MKSGKASTTASDKMRSNWVGLISDIQDWRMVFNVKKCQQSKCKNTVIRRMAVKHCLQWKKVWYQFWHGRGSEEELYSEETNDVPQ